MAREYTDKLLELIDEGVFDRDVVIAACLSYMSEADVEDMCDCNGFTEAMIVEDEDYDIEDDFPMSLEYDEGDY